MAELVDALGSGPSLSNKVGVRVPLSAPFYWHYNSDHRNYRRFLRSTKIIQVLNSEMDRLLKLYFSVETANIKSDSNVPEISFNLKTVYNKIKHQLGCDFPTFVNFMDQYEFISLPISGKEQKSEGIPIQLFCEELSLSSHIIVNKFDRKIYKDSLNQFILWRDFKVL